MPTRPCQRQIIILTSIVIQFYYFYFNVEIVKIHCNAMGGHADSFESLKDYNGNLEGTKLKEVNKLTSPTVGQSVENPRGYSGEWSP